MKNLAYDMLTEFEKKEYRRLLGENGESNLRAGEISGRVVGKPSPFAVAGYLFYLGKAAVNNAQARSYVKSLVRKYNCQGIDKKSFFDYPDDIF